MALSGTLPIAWGLATGRVSDGVWMTLTAEAVSWVELKGSFAWRVRTLFMGAVLAVVFAVLGTVTATSLWASVVGMFLVAFLATLLKNIGDRASGLAICVYLLFIICNAFAVADSEALKHRMLLMAVGAVWPVLVGVVTSLFMPGQQPFRRQIALIWRSIGSLVETINNNKQGVREDLYVKEKDVRSTLDSSYQFYGRMAHQVNKQDNTQYQLALLRKTAGVVAVNVIAMGEEVQQIHIPSLDETLRIKASTLFAALNEAVNRISVYVITLKPEEKLLAVSHINRLRKLVALIRIYPMPADEKQANAIKRILQLSERTARLLDNAIMRIEQMGKDVRVYRSYSLIKTSFLLNPKYLFRNLKALFNFNTLTIRYVLRSAIAATVALLLYKILHIDRGYWLPFSVMIVIQPYFGATFKKAFDRVVGTLLGGVAGGLLMHVPVGYHLTELILFVTFVVMVYYTQKNYALAVFAVTLNLVLLFNLESEYSNMLMVTRALCTIGGSMLAVLSGVALLPAWDKKWLPSHLAEALKANYQYFIASFYVVDPAVTWTRPKRLAESKNTDVFDSYNRYMLEPGRHKTEEYYDVITCLIRITRDLNNIHLEQEEKKTSDREPITEQQQARVDEALDWFNKVIALAANIKPLGIPVVVYKPGYTAPFSLNRMQLVALEKLIIELKAIHEDLEKLVGRNIWMGK